MPEDGLLASPAKGSVLTCHGQSLRDQGLIHRQEARRRCLLKRLWPCRRVFFLFQNDYATRARLLMTDCLRVMCESMRKTAPNRSRSFVAGVLNQLAFLWTGATALSSFSVTSASLPVDKSKTNPRIATLEGIHGCDLSFSTCFCVADLRRNSSEIYRGPPPTHRIVCECGSRIVPRRTSPFRSPYARRS